MTAARPDTLVPAPLQAAAGRGPVWADWLDRLPTLTADLLAEWGLERAGASMSGYCSLVVPVHTAQESPAVLKVSFDGDGESVHEGLVLQRWQGHGSVRLLRADPNRRALLLERLHVRDLTEVWDVEACETVAGLYGALHVPALPQLRPLSEYTAHVAERLRALPRSAPIPPRLVEQAASLASAFAADPATDGTLIHSDLHYENVLAAERAPWLAIDPKPLSGDPHYELAPLLWNRFDELAGRVRDGVRDRFFAVVDAAGLDEARARDWVIVRMLDLARQRLEDPPEAARGTTDADLLTMCVSVAKAVQD